MKYLVHSLVHQDLLEARVDQIGHQLTVVSSNCFDTFAVHFVKLFRFSPVQSGVPESQRKFIPRLANEYFF